MNAGGTSTSTLSKVRFTLEAIQPFFSSLNK